MDPADRRNNYFALTSKGRPDKTEQLRAKMLLPVVLVGLEPTRTLVALVL